MNQGFSFSVERCYRHNRARAGKLHTPHGMVHTPVFMPVGTVGSVKALSPSDLVEAGVEIILGNTYHLYLRPGDRVVNELGGLQRFMRWNRPILTDSGGYQVSSLGKFRNEDLTVMAAIDNDGVTFKSHLDGSIHRFTPEKAIEVQENLGADIIMAFDEATPTKGRTYARQAMDRTHVWLERCIKAWRYHEENKAGSRLPQALFGIIQGGNYRDLRRASAEFVVEKGLSGMAIGGASIGKNPEETEENVSWIADLLPKKKPVYLMGVGVNPEDVIGAIACGADLFDCVAPTRLARMGHLYSGKLIVGGGKWGFRSEFPRGRLNIDQARFVLDRSPIDEDCDCETCKNGFSRGYLHHLFRSRELLYYRLASIHNVRFMVRLTERLRKSIMKDLGKDKSH